ncbi:MAG: MBL fold metallo-hydrolase [Betaproteobacteria bacterium]|jgi:L-ascorbate metabolism protein UlaG (beta-lactamase superfamily)
MSEPVATTYLGSATVLIESLGLRILTDPVLDAAGTAWQLNKRLASPSLAYVNQQGAALPVSALPPIDLVLLSHDQHRDNLDRAGLELARRAGQVITTPAGAQRLVARGLTQVRGLEPGESIEVPIRDGHDGPLRVTATPARHGRNGTRWITGDVIGFMLRHPRWGRTYITGDTVWFDGLEALRSSEPLDRMFVHLGAARFGRGWLRCLHWSMSVQEAVRLTNTLQPRRVVPIHFEGWSHFTEGRAEVARAFAHAGLADRLVWLPRGERVAQLG